MSNSYCVASSSWIEYEENSDFPIQNIPFGIFRLGETDRPRCATRIGNTVVDLSFLQEKGFIGRSAPFERAPSCFSESTLNSFMELGRPAWRTAREEIQHFFSSDNTTFRDDLNLQKICLFDASEVEMLLPARIGDYTDFYASKEHATNVGIMFRGIDNALQPNWIHLPVGYHGRSSSVVVSGTPLHRPRGQLKPENDPPVHGVCKLADFELEMGFFVGKSTELGYPLSAAQAFDHVFGMVLLNDWSARDIQKWEYVPLGPFGAKNWGTTISPWVITLDALEPFLCEGPLQDPAPLPYLDEQTSKRTYDINLEVDLLSEKMQQEGSPAVTISHSNLRYMYWSIFQQLAHHTVTGCNMQVGDLLGTGTISGPSEGEYGSMLELCWKGTKTIDLGNGEERKFLLDHDTVILRGFCQGEGFRIGFGECVGQLLPAVDL